MYTRFLHPLITKVQLQMREPLAIKTSLAHPVKKKAARTSTMVDFRNISIRSYIMKSHHGFLQDLFRNLVASAFYVNQFGGIRHKGTEMASAFIKWRTHLAQLVSSGITLFFLDVQSAYYSVLHACLDPHSFDDATLGDIIDQMDIPIAFCATLEKLLSAPGAISSHIHDAHLEGMLHDTIRNTWFASREGCEAARARCGTSPGDPLADLYYTVTISPTLKAIDERIAHCGRSLPSPSGLDESLLDVLHLDHHCDQEDAYQAVYCDGYDIPSLIVDPDSLLDDLGVVPKITRDLLLNIGLRLNWKPQKSALMPMFSGKYKKDLWRRCADITCVPIAGEDTLTLVHSYVHLGGVIAPDFPVGPANKHRKSCAAHRLNAYRRVVAAKSYLPIRDKVIMAEPLALSSTLHGALLWDRFSVRESKSCATAVLAVYQAATCTQPKCKDGVWVYTSDIKTMAVASRLDWEHNLSMQKLRFLSRVCIQGGPHLQKTLLGVLLLDKCAGSWPDLLRKDFAWLNFFSPLLAEMPRVDCAADWAPWLKSALNGESWIK